MGKAIVKKNEFGKPIISCHYLLADEPVALYVNRESREFSLSLTNGSIVSLGTPANCPELLSLLLSMHEITIESECGGLLAAGYHVGVREQSIYA